MTAALEGSGLGATIHIADPAQASEVASRLGGFTIAHRSVVDQLCS